jgi:membrane-associated phospholipid phosphatase
MTSQVDRFKKGMTREQTLSIGTRLLLVVLVWCVQSFYIPTSNRTFGGIEPKLPIDVFPVWAIWVVPYVLCYLVWISMTFWAVFKMDDHLFRSLIAAGLITCSLAVSTFIFFPTYVRAEHIPGSDFPSRLLNFIHQNSGRYNAFPSGHVYITVLLALFYNRWYPGRKFYWILIPVIISFSTLFTHQHYIADIVGGVVVALIGYYSGLLWARYFAVQNGEEKRSPVRPRS